MRFVAGTVLSILFASAVVAETGPRVDATRTVRGIDEKLVLVPDASDVKLAATGFEEPLSSLMWVRAILTFGANFGAHTDPSWHEWFRRMVETTSTLDSYWRTPYYYGGTLLRVLGNVEASDAVFAAAHAARPEDPFFPFSLGMNAYLYREDPDEAARWLRIAAATPNAPPWYESAAAAMLKHSGQRAAGIRYLEDVLRDAQDPATRADAERQLGRLRHDDLVDSWAEACRAWRDQNGPLASPDELARLGIELPPNPRGDAWIVGADGVVRSEAAEKERIRRRLMAEWAIVRR